MIEIDEAGQNPGRHEPLGKMIFAPRPYQQEALESIEATYARGVKSTLLVLPTGTGKTQVFAWLIGRRHARGDLRPALVVAHREELLQQARERIRQIVPHLRVEIERADSKASRGASVVVASVQTIGRPDSGRLEWLTGKDDEAESLFSAAPPQGGYPGLIIIDEAHHAAAAGYGQVIRRFSGPETQVLGVTATPKRMDRQALHGAEGAAFAEVSYSYPIRQAITDGWLADVRGYRVDGGVDLSGVDARGGDFAAGALARAVDAPERTDAALRHWTEVARERRTIVFCAGVDHAAHVAEAFREKGVTAESADGATSRQDRAAIIERFRSGETQVLSNCELFTEGFDVPEAACALLLRPTQSWSLYVQMVGRVTRLAPGKTDAIVIDVVDNCNRHRLATVPAILDLPPGLDLEGQSLARAAQAIDEMGERSAVLQRVLPGSWSELQTLLQSVDLFASLETPEELGDVELRWMSCPGGYRLDFGEGRVAELRQDAVGMWWLDVTQWIPEHNRRERVYRKIVGDEALTVAEVAAAADGVVLQRWPRGRALAARKSAWHGKRPSDKQIGLLRRLGQPESVLEALTMGQASALISQLLGNAQGSISAGR